MPALRGGAGGRAPRGGGADVLVPAAHGDARPRRGRPGPAPRVRVHALWQHGERQELRDEGGREGHGAGAGEHRLLWHHGRRMGWRLREQRAEARGRRDGEKRRTAGARVLGRGGQAGAQDARGRPEL